MLTNSSDFSCQDFPSIPGVLSALLAPMSAVGVWSDNPTSTIRDQIPFIAPVIQFNDTVNLHVFHRLVVLLIFSNISTVVWPNFEPFLPSPKTKIILYSNDCESNFDKNLTEKLRLFSASKFLWVIHCYEVQLFCFNEENELEETDYENATLVLKDSPRMKNIPNFQGKEINIGVFNNSIFSYTLESTNGTIIVDGFQALLLVDACRLMNLTTVIHPVVFTQKSLKGGTPVPSLLLDLLEQKTDAVASGLFMRLIFADILGMTYPWEAICVRYLVPRPVLLNSKSEVFGNVFSMEIWIALGISLVLVSIAASIVATLQRSPEQSRFRNVFYNIMWMLLDLLQMYSPSRAEYNRGLVPILVAWGWFSFIITAVYNSELAASLTNPFFSEKIQTEKQFVQHGYSWGSSVYIQRDLIFDMSDPYINLWATDYCIDEKEGDREKNMKKGRYVVIGYSYNNIFYFILDQKSPPDDVTADYEVADHCAMQKLSGVYFSPGSPYAEGVNLIYGRLMSAGILQKLEYEYTMRSSLLLQHVPTNVFIRSQDGPNIVTFSQLPLTIFYGPIQTLFIGYAAAAVVFCVFEVAKSKWDLKKARLKKQQTLSNRKLQPKYVNYEESVLPSGSRVLRFNGRRIILRR